MIDEFQKLFSDEERWSERALTYLVQLAREGRAYGIHLILASQTLSGITSLLTQQDGIFAQFPIRLALKNSSSESQVVLGTNNPDAARLRFRGEIIVNEDFGMVEANRRGIVANAAPQETAEGAARIVGQGSDITTAFRVRRCCASCAGTTSQRIKGFAGCISHSPGRAVCSCRKCSID